MHCERDTQKKQTALLYGRSCCNNHSKRKNELQDNNFISISR